MPNTALYEYKALGYYPDVPSRLLVDVFTDLEYRKTWDKNMVGFKRLEHGVIQYTTKFPWPLSPREYFYELTVHEPKDGHFCVSSQTVGKTRAADGTLQNLHSANNYKSMVTLAPTSVPSSPSPSSLSLLQIPGRFAPAASSVSLPMPGSGQNSKVFKLPAMSKSVRVEEYRQDVVMAPSEDGKGCYIWFGYFDDPKVRQMHHHMPIPSFHLQPPKLCIVAPFRPDSRQPFVPTADLSRLPFRTQADSSSILQLLSNMSSTTWERRSFSCLIPMKEEDRGLFIYLHKRLLLHRSSSLSPPQLAHGQPRTWIGTKQWFCV